MKHNYKKREQIYVDEKVITHKKNIHLDLLLGWATIDKECTPACPDSTVDGFYMCIGGNCVFFPNP